MLRNLSTEYRRPMRHDIDLLQRDTSRRRILNDDFRAAAASILGRMTGVQTGEEEVSRIREITGYLRSALYASHRVADLLAAEMDVGWHRELGRDG